MICDTLSRTPLCPNSEARDAPFQFCTIAELPSQNPGLIVTPTIGAQVLLGAVPAFRSANDGKSLTSTHAALDIFNRLTEGRDIACLKRKDSRVRIENSGLVPRVCGHRALTTIYLRNNAQKILMVRFASMINSPAAPSPCVRPASLHLPFRSLAKEKGWGG